MEKTVDIEKTNDSNIIFRNTLGVLGASLPILDACFNLIFGRGYNAPGVLSSISATYYSASFVFFVGIVFATGIFLIRYRGYDVADRRVSKIAGIGALVLVFFPCKFELAETRNFMMLPQDVTNIFHLAGALVFFGALIFMIVFQFTKTTELKPTGRKLARNILYVTCGIIMLISLIIGFGGSALFGWRYSVYLGEWVALWAYCAAYLTKGGVILKDL